MTQKSLQTNFAILHEHDEQLVRLDMLAEKHFSEDPNTCLLKPRQCSELLAQLIGARMGIYTITEETQYDLIRRLQDQEILPRQIALIFTEIRRAGNAANRANQGDHQTALTMLKMAWQLSVWIHKTFKVPSFIPLASPEDQSMKLCQELERLKKALNFGWIISLSPNS